MSEKLGIIKKPQFDTEFLCPGRVLTVYVPYNNGTEFSYNYKGKVIIHKSEPFKLEVVDKTTDVKAITLEKVLSESIIIEEVI